MWLKLFLFLLFLVPVEWKKYETPEFTIQYPDNWELDKSGQSGTKFILFCPLIQGANFRENVNLVTEDLKGTNVDLKQYTELSVGQISKYITDAKILSQETTTISGGQRFVIIYTGKQGTYNLKWKQYLWVRKETAFVLTYTASQPNFDKELVTVNKVMDSFGIR